MIIGRRRGRLYVVSVDLTGLCRPQVHAWGFFVPKNRRSALPALTPARILTVEDDPIVRADLRLVLEDAGFAVCADARDGAEAVDLAREHRPDLVLIDLVLPGLDGVEATRRILRERDIPIVALTGHSKGGFVERAHEAGAVAHVLKPFGTAQLVNTITDALADRASPNETEAVTEAERCSYRLLATIESMVREGYSQREIAVALDQQYDLQDRPSLEAGRFSRIRSLFVREP
jgi:two-component system, response regulator PdtaR